MSRPVETITDARGRVIELTTLSVLEQYRLRHCIRPELRTDQMANSIATAAAGVRSIGGVPVPVPNTVEMLESIIDKLGDEGWAAVLTHQERKLQEARDTIEAAIKAGEGPLDPSAPLPTPPA